MRELAGELRSWRAMGRQFALAVVTQTWGSSPRPAGSWMAVREDGAVIGSVSAGCVESAVIESALKTIERGGGEWLTFEGLDPEDIWRVGLSCGGKMRVLVTPGDSDALWRAIELAEAEDQFVSLINESSLEVWVPGTEEGSLAARAFDEQETLEEGGLVAVYNRPRPRLLIIGAVHIALSLVALAGQLGYRTIVVDPRTALATTERFPTSLDEMRSRWPQQVLPSLKLDRDTFAVVLTHDPKIDDPALELLLKSQVAYIGALGSRTSHAQRRDRLAERGFSPEELDRIHGPIGLSIGAKSPEEIALSILAEIVQVRRLGG
jgi:xanthine dehydrogenase accessory factor